MSRDHLKRLYREGRLIPFIGAGVSTSVRWVESGIEKAGPSWKQMVDQAAEQLGFSMPDLLRVRGTDLQILEYFKIRNAGQFASLTNWFVANMRPADHDLLASPIHEELSALTNCNLMYTTNYDDFIERSFRLRGRAFNAVVVEDHMGRANPGCEIIKFHGDWNNPSAMVLSESDYEMRLKLATALDHRLRADLLGRAVLFIGYSFRDPNVSYLFRLMNEQFAALPSSLSGRRAYIVTPEPCDFEVKLFDARNIEVLPISAEQQTDDIAGLISDIRR